MAGIHVDVGVQHDDVGEAQHGFAVGLVDGVAPFAIGVVLLHAVSFGRSIIDKPGLVGLAVGDFHILAIGDDGAVLVGVGAVDGVAQVAHRVVLPVIHKIEEGGIVGAVHVNVIVSDDLGNIVGVGIHGVFQRKAVVVALAGPVHTAVIPVAIGAVVVVHGTVLVILRILLHDNGLSFMDIQRLPGQDELEELVTAGTHGADLPDVLIVIIHRHKAGDAALDLDLHQHLGVGQAALGTGRHDVVHHHGGDTLTLRVIGSLGFTGEGVCLIGRQRGGGHRRSLDGSGRRRAGDFGFFLSFAASQHHAQSQQHNSGSKTAFHGHFPLFLRHPANGPVPQSH